MTKTLKLQAQKSETLLKHPKLWRARELARQQSQSRQGTSSGYAVLDQLLPDKGWPAAALMELLMPSAGIGELRLLIPAIKHLSCSQARWVAWINPPFIPYAPALKALGVDTGKILLIHPRTHEDALWALERATRSGSCSLAMAWLDERQLKFKDTQRLQVASRQGETLTCLFRPTSNAPVLQASMAELRLQLHDLSRGELKLDILKRRGSWPLPGLTLSVAEATSTQRLADQEIQEQLELWRSLRPKQSLEQDRSSDAEIQASIMTETTGPDLAPMQRIRQRQTSVRLPLQ